MKTALIAAVAQDGTIGHAGKIPWHISDDLKRFKRLTLGHPVIMGRRTFESIGKPLPGRRNIVLTRGAPIPGVECFNDLSAALRHLRPEVSEGHASAWPLSPEKQLGRVKARPSESRTLNSPTVFIIGGAEVYRTALPVADTLLLTHVKHPGGGDTKFPEYDLTQWKEISHTPGVECDFVTYERVSGSP